jgi:hypothetical protein
MPIEIRELTIKVTVNQEQSNIAPAAGSSTNANDADTKQAIIKEAVEQMIRIIEHKNER